MLDLKKATTFKPSIQAQNNLLRSILMKVLGIDPGFARVGVALVEKKNGEKETLVFSRCIETSAHEPLPSRLQLIAEEVSAIIQKYTPDAMAIEKLFFGSNQKTAIRVAEARGVLIQSAASAHVAVHEYTPLQIKIAVTGYGRATKTQVADMVARLIVLKKKKRIDDEVDAIAIALTHCAHTKIDHRI